MIVRTMCLEYHRSERDKRRRKIEMSRKISHHLQCLIMGKADWRLSEKRTDGLFYGNFSGFAQALISGASVQEFPYRTALQYRRPL